TTPKSSRAATGQKFATMSCTCYKRAAAAGLSLGHTPWAPTSALKPQNMFWSCWQSMGIIRCQNNFPYPSRVGLGVGLGEKIYHFLPYPYRGDAERQNCK